MILPFEHAYIKSYRTSTTIRKMHVAKKKLYIYILLKVIKDVGDMQVKYLDFVNVASRSNVNRTTGTGSISLVNRRTERFKREIERA